MANEQVARSVLCNGGPDVALAALQLNLDDGWLQFQLIPMRTSGAERS
jgi:hypothetical protein